MKLLKPFRTLAVGVLIGAVVVPWARARFMP